MDDFEYFIRNILPLIVLILGTFGNTIGFLVFSRKRFQKLSVRNVCRFLAVTDTICLIQIIEDYSTFEPRNFTNLTCQILRYFNFSLGPISSWVLVYITIERFISIAFPKQSALFKKRKYQISFVLIISFYNFAFYLPIPLFVLLVAYSDASNSTNASQSYLCDFRTENSRRILSLLDLANSTLIPFALMFVNSTLIIYAIFKSRKKMMSTGPTNKANKSLKKDIRFAVTSVFLNAIFFILNLPICAIGILSIEFSVLFIQTTVYVYYSNFAVNYYIFFFFNSIFRDECLVMIGLRKPHHHHTTTTNNNK